MAGWRGLLVRQMRLAAGARGSSGMALEASVCSITRRDDGQMLA
jgi:hypothetical protein